MINSQKPLDLLSKSLDQRVLIKLKGGRELRGKLRGFDQHMNLVLENARKLFMVTKRTLKILELL